MSDETVVSFTGLTTNEIPPDRVLEEAVGELSEALLIGVDHNGDIYVASSGTSTGRNLALLEVAKRKLVRIVAHHLDPEFEL